jgi:ribosomal protein S18 acetylase RimI-like enzyme
MVKEDILKYMENKMGDIKFLQIENNIGKQLQNFMNLWLSYMYEIGDKRDKSEILGHAKKILEIQEQKRKENKIYNIVLCVHNDNIIGFCFFSLMEIKFQNDTAYGLVIKPLVNNNDYGYIMEFYIRPEYRLKGYGKIMYSYIEKKYKENKIKKIVLTADVKAIAFWEKLNFSNSGKIDPTNDLSIFLKNI